MNSDNSFQIHFHFIDATDGKVHIQYIQVAALLSLSSYTAFMHAFMSMFTYCSILLTVILLNFLLAF
jgi:hypothetical protein